jgi:hypothetical protein
MLLQDEFLLSEIIFEIIIIAISLIRTNQDLLFIVNAYICIYKGNN